MPRAPGTLDPTGTPEPAQHDQEAALPVMPGFREMALRRRADEQAARMAEDRGRLVRELAGQRERGRPVADRGGGPDGDLPVCGWPGWNPEPADVRASTLERYAAAVGGQITWKLDRPGEGEGKGEGASG